MEDAVARKERAELVVDEDTAELGVVNEEGVMGVGGGEREGVEKKSRGARYLQAISIGV